MYEPTKVAAIYGKVAAGAVVMCVGATIYLQAEPGHWQYWLDLPLGFFFTITGLGRIVSVFKK